MRCDEAQELITARVDNELDPEERTAIDAHLHSCAECARSYEQESLLKRRIHLAAQQISAPMALRRIVEERAAASAATSRLSNWRELILGKLHFLKHKQPDVVAKERARPERSRAGFKPRSQTRWLNEAALPAWRGAFAVALLVVIGVSVYYTERRSQKEENFALAAFDIHTSIVSGKTALLRAVNLAAMRNEMAHAVGNRFRPVVLDLSMMNFHAIAGFVQNIGGRDLLVTVYHGDGPPITCFTFLGSDADAPAGAERFFDAATKVAFYSFSRSDVNGVLHREGEVMCLLVSKMAPADLLALLRGKSAHAMLHHVGLSE